MESALFYVLSGSSALIVSAAVLYATWIYFTMNIPKGNKKKLEERLADQSYVFDSKDNVRSSQFTKDQPLLDTYMEGLTTLHEVFQRGVRVARDFPCLGWRPTPESPYKWLTYAETAERVSLLGSGLGTLQSNKFNGEPTCVSIYASNCPEWALTQQVCSTFGYIIAPLYDTLGEEARKYILEQTQSPVCFCDSAARVRNILSDLKVEGLAVKHIIVIKPGNELESLRADAGDIVKIHTFNEVLAMGTPGAQPDCLPDRDDLHLLCYTSGTTGRAKGVMITHRMILAVIGSFDMYLQEVNIVPGDYYLSFLPLAHVFEQIVMHYAMGRGASIGFYSGDLRNLSNDILALRPTLFCAVPRVLQRLYGTVQDAVVGSRFKTWLLKTSIEAKMQYVKQGIVTRDTLWDKFALKPIQDRMGGRLRFFACGSAPISEDVYQFCRAALGVHAFEAYGLTETCGAMIMTLPHDYECGHTGAPMPCSLIKLVDVPDMDIYVDRDQMGEICVKGPSCTTGYYKDKERTKELIDEDGWLHSGDIGRWTERGCVQLVDRCKNMFKLTQGEYVSPEKVEMIYSQSPYVTNVFVDGNSKESFAIAIVVPNVAAIIAAMKSPNGAANGSAGKATSKCSQPRASDMTPEEVCESLEARLLVLKDLLARGKQNGLSGFEQAKSIFMTPHDFTVESGLVTPTQKKCRVVFRRLFKSQIAQLYSEDMLL